MSKKPKYKVVLLDEPNVDEPVIEEQKKESINTEIKTQPIPAIIECQWCKKMISSKLEVCPTTECGAMVEWSFAAAKEKGKG